MTRRAAAAYRAVTITILAAIEAYKQTGRT